MALIRPVLFSVPAFDATREQVFTFSVGSGGAQVTANKLTIRDNTTNVVVYDQTQTSFRYEHSLPNGTLTNGTYYNATVTTIDNNGNQSTPSVPIQFWCYSQPSIVVTNFPATGIVNSSAFEFQFEYTQAENEPLDSYKVELFDVGGNLVSTSGVLFAVNGTPPFTGSHVFSGFANATEYRVKVTGYTINKTIVESAEMNFSVRYIIPNVYSLLLLKNNCPGGYINIESNLLSIEGKTNPDPPKYIDNQEVDVTVDGDYVEWDEGYSIDGDMLTRLWFRSPNVNSTLLTMSNVGGDSIQLVYRHGYVNDDDSTELMAYMEAHVTMRSGIEYYIYSEYVSILDATSKYNLWLRRIGNVYQLEFGAL